MMIGTRYAKRVDARIRAQTRCMLATEPGRDSTPIVGRQAARWVERRTRLLSSFTLSSAVLADAMVAVRGLPALQ